MQSVDAGVLKTLGQVAGIGGVALGVMLLIFRSVIAKKIFPRLDKQHAFQLLRLIIVLAWSIGILGIIVYAFQKPKQSSPQEVAEDFQTSLLAVPKGDLKSNGALLALDNSGVFRILPRGKYKGQIAMAGEGSYYSFSRRTNEYGYGSDLELEDGSFKTGFAGLDYGLFLSLGDVQLIQLSGLSSEPPAWLPREKWDAWRFVWTFLPARHEQEIRSEQKHSEGWIIQGATLTDRVIATSAKTYLLRSINFGRSDLLVAIHVVEVMPDGSVVVAWRLLNQFDTPAVITKGS